MRKLYYLLYLLSIINITSIYSNKILFSDNFDDIKKWALGYAGGVKFTTESESGFDGNALRYNFDFSKSRGYALTGRDVDIKLPENFQFTFYMKGDVPRDFAIEFKLIDNNGNTFWKKISDFSFPKKWTKVTFLKDEINYAWGPTGKSTIDHLKRIEIGISTETNRTGHLLIDKLELVELAKTELIIDYDKIVVTASADENSQFPCKQAMDNNMTTRWSSPYSDPQWLKLDLGKIIDISGLIIFWEKAYGTDYDVLLSKNNIKWKQVYTMTDGDGGSDYVLFGKQPARFIKIYGRKRGTIWGYSINEIKLFQTDMTPEIKISSNKSESSNLIDGSMDNVWTAENKQPQTIILNLSNIQSFGGLDIYYKDCTVTKRELFSSENNKDWKIIYTIEKDINKKDNLYVNNFDGKYIKIKLYSDDKISIKEISFKGKDDILTPQKSFEIAAKQDQKGYYPLWLNKKQEYWTIVGIPNDDKETLISENGIIEPIHKSHIYFPVVKINDKLVTYADVETSQSLEKDYLPIPTVNWKHPKFNMTVKPIAADAGQKSSVYVNYTIKNNSRDNITGTFYLLIRPFQLEPPWMGGGAATINTIEYVPETSSMMKINNTDYLFTPVKPELYSSVTYKNYAGAGDIIQNVHTDKFPNTDKILNDENGLASSVIGYNFKLEPNEEQTYYFIIPLHGSENEIDKTITGKNVHSVFNQKYNSIKKLWENKLDRINIQVPDQEFINTVKTNAAYILINDDMHKLQPGSRNYEASWMRDGALTATAIMNLGFNDEVKRYLNWITGFVQPDGFVPFIIDADEQIAATHWKEFDSQGEYIYALLQYYLFNKDKDFLIDKKDEIIKVIKFIQTRLDERKTDEYKSENKKEFYGIFPESQSHEGYIYPPRHSYWDDFWGIRGLKDATHIFGILDDKKLAEWADEERKELEKNVYQSLDIVIKKHNIDYIPGCAELGDLDPTSTANGVWPCLEYKNMPEKELHNTFNIYWNGLKQRFDDNWSGGFTPYEIRIANAYIILDKTDKLYQMLSKFMEWKRPRPWNHWGEVVTADKISPQYLGDMPHTWVGAEFINVIRNMLILEEDNNLYLGKGIYKEWYEEGKEIEVTDMPTHFGNISYYVTSINDIITIKVEGSLKEVDNIIYKIPELDKKINSVTLNNKKYGNWQSGKIYIKQLPSMIKIKLLITDN